MYKKILFFISILCFMFCMNNNVFAQENTSFKCTYQIAADSLNKALPGELTCEMGYNYGWLGGAKLDCNWNVNGTSVWVDEKSTGDFNIISHLKSGSTTCPNYVAIQTSSATYEQTGFFSDGVKAYFSNTLSEVQSQVATSGTYYNYGKEKNYESKELDNFVCSSKDLAFYNKLWKNLEKGMEDFKANNCDNFSVTEEERNNVLLPDSSKKYKKCESYLNYSSSFFRSEINDLKDYQSKYNCFSNDDYNNILNKLTTYQDTYANYLNKLKASIKPIGGSGGSTGPTSPITPTTPTQPSIPEPEIPITDIDIKTFCAKPSFRKPMKFLGTIVNFLKIIVPMLIIGLGIMDLYKGVTGAKEDALKKSMKSLGVRVVAGVFVFLLPGLVQFVLSMVNEWSDYKNTWCCCTECILNSDCDTSNCNSNTCHIEGMN